MKWGKKKSSYPSSSLFSRVFSGSWFSKLKPSNGSGQRNEGDSSLRNKEEEDVCEMGYGYPTRFYSLEEADLDWMVPVVDKRVQGRRSTGGINPLWSESGYKFRSFGVEEAEVQRRDQFLSFSDMVMDVKKRQSEKQREEVSSSCILSPVKEDDDHMSRFSDMQSHNIEKEMKVKTRIESSSEKKPAKSRKKTKSPRIERRNRSTYIDKSRMKAQDREEDDEETVFNSFATVKNSSNPYNDFRDSMIEMIQERGICHPKDLEQLLSCYLMLNSDEYHDLIIQVFRQVWSEMNPQRFTY